MTYRLHQLLNL